MSIDSPDEGSPIWNVPYAAFRWVEAWRHLTPHLSATLLKSEDLEQLAAFAGKLPGSWHWGMFETQLGDTDMPADLLSAMVQLPETRSRLQALIATREHASLNPVQPVLASWSEDRGDSFSDSPNLWLEWDRDGQNKPPIPWLCLAPDFFNRKLPSLAPEEIGTLADIFMRSDPHLEVEGASACLVELAKSLPAGGKLMGFASLKPRGRNICRAFAKLPRGGTVRWLASIGWKGDHEQLKAALPLFVVEGEDEWCQVEFDRTVGPYVALELAQSERGFPRREPREHWFNEVVQRNWASREKADAVLAWHGETRCTINQSLPVRLLRSFHVKLVMKPEEPPLAKAYLGFYFRKKKRALAA